MMNIYSENWWENLPVQVGTPIVNLNQPHSKAEGPQYHKDVSPEGNIVILEDHYVYMDEKVGRTENLY